MSGGHWQYVGGLLETALLSIATDPTVLERWPRVAALFGALGAPVRLAEHEMDWDLSSDHAIVDDRAFQDHICHAILEAAMKVADDRLFPRGKWATIQAIQERIVEARDDDR